jgi:membrane associated rhomboid family serine protease
MRLPPARATLAIIGVTSLAWAVAAFSGMAGEIVPLAGFIPARVSVDLAIAQAAPVWLTPVTATLVHAGLLHLAFNMLIVGFCGRLVEASLGIWGIAALYLVGAYAAAGAQYFAAPLSTIPMIGASGAASAVIGAYALLYGKHRAKGWGPLSGTAVHVLWLAAAWIGLQMLVGLASGGIPGVPDGATVAVAAHIGGFLAGLILARPLLLLRYRSA